MNYIDLVDDTICSLVTPPGVSGIALLRVSGSNSEKYCRSIAPGLPSPLESHHCYYTKLRSSEDKNKIIDEVLVTYFAKGKSFTGDECVEISCHGGNLNWKLVLNNLIKAGCRMARKGEFSFRAFFNGKIDLIQAEAIHSLIESKSEKAQALSVEQLQGNLSSELMGKEGEMIHVLAQLEASIDFSTEDIEPAPVKELLAELNPLSSYFEQLKDSYSLGKKISEGQRVVLAGSPNAGKSSLYNYLVGADKAIVTEIAGTTRDVLSEPTRLENGVVIEFFDTAGLRETTDIIEKMGVEKTEQELASADLILWVIDPSQVTTQPPKALLVTNSLIIFNKIDLFPGGFDYPLPTEFLELDQLKVSVKDGAGLDKIIEWVSQKSEINKELQNNVLIQRRHFDSIEKITQSLCEAISQVSNLESPDLISQELQVGLFHLHQLMGKQYDDEIIDSIFGQFCLGK